MVARLWAWWCGYQARQQRAAWVAELGALYSLMGASKKRANELERAITAFDKRHP